MKKFLILLIGLALLIGVLVGLFLPVEDLPNRPYITGK